MTTSPFSESSTLPEKKSCLILMYLLFILHDAYKAYVTRTAYSIGIKTLPSHTPLLMARTPEELSALRLEASLRRCNVVVYYLEQAEERLSVSTDTLHSCRSLVNNCVSDKASCWQLAKPVVSCK